jgi:hypothetical protein
MNVISTPNSSTWLQEFMPYVNGQRVRWDDLALNLPTGDVCTLTLDYEYSWLIGDPDAHIVMDYQSGEEGQGLVFDPPLGKSVEMAEGTTSLSWTITATGAPSGPFVLQFAIPQIVEMPKSPPVPGAILNLAQELEVKFDEFPVSFGANAYPCHGAKHTFTVLPKPASQLLNKNIKLLMGGENLGVVVRPSLANEQLLTPEGVRWELNCLNTTQNGCFSLQLLLVKLEVSSSPLAMSLDHNLVTAQHWSQPAESLPGYPRTLHGIRSSSSFLKVPVSGVPVSQQVGHDTFHKSTDVNGEVKINVEADVIVSMSIINRYDGSVV